MKPHGTVQLSRINGNFDLFASRIPVDTAVALRVYEAEVSDDYGSERVHHNHRPLIEVYLTPNQFSELLTTMNVSSGVPCTIKHIDGRNDIEPFEKRDNARDRSEDYLKEILSELDEKIVELQKTADSLKLPKKAKESLELQIRVLRDHFASNIPFVGTVFKEEMDKVVTEAKADVDALVTHTVTQLGIKSLKNKKYLLED